MRTPTTALAILVVTSGFLLAGCFGGDDPTKASFTATAGNADKTSFKFDASGSTGSGLVFDWDFGDRTPHGTRRVEEHTYEYPDGEYTVTLTVTGKGNTTSRVSQKLQVGSGENEAPVLFLSADKRWVKPNETVAFDATESYDGNDDALFFEWDFNSPLSEQEFGDMQDLGMQQYSRYSYGPPRNESGGDESGGGDDSGSRSMLTPSGHDWQAEYEKAKQRLVVSKSRDGGHGSAEPEPRNADFDGKIEDNSPIQLFQFPSPATYFVHLRLFDVKGEMAEGFLKIKVSDSVPPEVENHQANGIVLVSNSLDPLQGQASGSTDSRRSHQFTYNFSGRTEIKISFVKDPDVSLEAKANLWVCKKDYSITECKATPAAKRESAPTGSTLVHSIDAGAAFPITFQVIVENAGQARIKYDLAYPTYLDINPWAPHESGLMKGH